MIVVATSRAGGSGKTSTSVHLAAAWARQRRTLLIDLDEQADASNWLGRADTGEDLAKVLLNGCALRSAIRSTDFGVDVAAGGEALSHVSDSIGRDAVRRAVASVRRDYDAVVIDCPPSLRKIVLSAWCVAPDAKALVPVDSPKALASVARLWNAWEDAGLNTRRINVVLIRHDARRLLDKELELQTRELYGDQVLTAKIRETVLVRESGAWRRPIAIHAPRHPASDDFAQLAEEVYNG